MRPSLLTLLLCALIVCFATSAFAATVVVKPSAMGGWVTAAQSPAYEKFVPVCPPNDDLGTHSGSGCWYVYTFNAEQLPLPDNPPQGNGWIGTNAYAGVALANITRLDYKCWNDDSGIWQTRGCPACYRQLNNPRQPMVLELLIDIDPDQNPGNPNYQRLLRCMPAGSKNQGLLGSVPEGYAGYGGGSPTLQRHWAPWNGMSATTYWLEIMPTATAGVYDWADNTWATINAAYPNAKIAASAPVGWEWPDFDTPTGCALNFVYGALYQRGNLKFDPAHAIAGAWGNWFRDSVSAHGHLDDFSIGVNGEETTYDFEADGPAPVYALGTKDARVRPACGIYEPNVPGTSCVHNWPLGTERYRFALYGKVVSDPVPGLRSFYLDDGYNKPTEVLCPGYADLMYPPTPGEYWRAEGYLQIDYTQMDGDPEPLVGNPDIHPRLLCVPDDLTLLWSPYY